MRLTITARLALLALGLALAIAVAMAALIWQQTREDALDTLRRDTIEQSDTLATVYRTGGLHALRQTIPEVPAPGDDSLIAALLDSAGRRVAGQGPDALALPIAPTRFRIAVLASSGKWSSDQSGFAIRRVGSHWLVSGRLLDDWGHAQHTIERALLLALLLAAVLGVLAGAVLTRYVTKRLERVVRVVDAVAAGELGRRVGVQAGGGDAFDRLARQIDFMLDKIERLMGELRIVTDSIAHDLRSPIARLRSRAEQALVTTDSAQRDVALQGLTAETDLVMRMLTTLLEISRTEAAGRSAFVDYAPAELIEEIADLYIPAAEDAGMTLRVDIADPPPPPLPMHRELLSQAIANLIDNAMRHAPEGDEILLRVALGQGTGQAMGQGVLRITVADRGPGIPVSAREQALKRFGRLDGARSKPGAGLGLTLVESVARLHGGGLELGEHAPGLAATIVIPLSPQGQGG